MEPRETAASQSWNPCPPRGISGLLTTLTPRSVSLPSGIGGSVAMHTYIHTYQCIHTTIRISLGMCRYNPKFLDICIYILHIRILTWTIYASMCTQVCTSHTHKHTCMHILTFHTQLPCIATLNPTIKSTWTWIWCRKVTEENGRIELPIEVWSKFKPVRMLRAAAMFNDVFDL